MLRQTFCRSCCWRVWLIGTLVLLGAMDGELAASAGRGATRRADHAGRRDIGTADGRESVEPGVFGIRRPVLVLPRGIVDRLSTEQLDAIVAHELCHMRRRDNLTAALHMAVEVTFWFHPLVWWLQTRLVEERERACDEAVLEHDAATVRLRRRDPECLQVLCGSAAELRVRSHRDQVSHQDRADPFRAGRTETRFAAKNAAASGLRSGDWFPDDAGHGCMWRSGCRADCGAGARGQHRRHVAGDGAAPGGRDLRFVLKIAKVEKGP